MTSFRKSLDIFRKRTHRDWGHVVTGLTLDGSPYPETVHVAPMRPDQAPTLFNVRALAPQAARVAGMANGPLDAEAGAAAWANEAHDGFIGRRMHGQRMRTVYGPGGEAWSMEHLAAHDVWARSGHGASRRPQTPAVLAAAREEWLAEHPSTKRMLQKHAVEYPNDLMAGYNRLRDRLVQGGADDDSNVEIIDPAALPDVTQQRTLRSPRRGTPPNADRRSEGHRTASIARALAKRGPATAVDQHDQAGPRKQPRAH